MKKYTPIATKWLAAISLICGAMVVVGIVLGFMESGDSDVVLLLISMGTMLGIIVFPVFLASRTRYLLIDEKTIILPRGTAVNGKVTLGKRTVIQRKDILSLSSQYYRAPLILKILADHADQTYHTITLKDGTSIRFQLSEYGKKAEKEILAIIRQSIE